MCHAPVSAAGRVQDLVMLLQDFTETGKVQVLPAEKKRETLERSQGGA